MEKDLVNTFVRIFTSRFLLLSSVAVIVGCSGPRLRVQSEPSDVEVFIAHQTSKDRKPIGKTPLEITFQELNEKAAISSDAGDYAILIFDSKAIEPEKVLVPLMSIGMKTTVVKVKLEPRQDIKFAGDILQRLHNAQKFAQAGQYERAQIECDKVLESDPEFVRALSMKASIYYVQKNFDESLKWYEKALAADPAFDEAIKMIAKIKQEKK